MSSETMFDERDREIFADLDFKHLELLADEQKATVARALEKPNCEICNDTGVYEKTEWSGTDDSYEVEKKCYNCNFWEVVNG